MKIGEWWTSSSGAAKTVVVLSMLLLLQIGVCALTPAMLPWVYALLDSPNRNDPLGWMSPMFWQAFVCVITVVAIFCVWSGIPPKPKP